MSESQTNMEARLKTLQCHFTWEELVQEIKPWVVRADLEDIGTDEGNCWLPHIYNLLGYLHHRLGSDEEALRFLNLATEEFNRRHTEEGPWMMVNYGNLAWLHHLMGHQPESERYLSKVEDLRSQHPNVSQDDLHAEVTAEKAWTLMTLVNDHLKKVEELFLAAIEKEPERVEWKTSLALALVRAQKHKLPLTDDVWQRLERARQENPENVYIAIKHFDYGEKKDIDVDRDKAREMAELVLRNPVSSYSGLKAILRVYREFLSIDDAVELAEEALREHPDERFLKKCAALCYLWRVIYYNRKEIYVPRATMNRAINLHQEVIALYPDTCLVKEMNLAAIQGCRDPEVGDKMFQELLARDLDDLNKQMLSNHYAKFLFFNRRDYSRSVEYHMKAAEMKSRSYFRDNSIKFLREPFRKNTNFYLRTEIEDFLKNLPTDEP